MARKVLLLNGNYDVLDFLNERKAIKLLFKDKVEILSEWPNVIIFFSSGSFNFPAILKLKYVVKRRFRPLIFSRNMVFKRDRYCCQYCGKYLMGNQATMDHIVPRSKGGISSFTNCITACYACNNKKGNRTLEEAQMKPISTPMTPVMHLCYLSNDDKWHQEWNSFIRA